MALPGIKAQTTAKDIEGALAAKPGVFRDDIKDRVEGIDSVKVAEVSILIPRGAAVAEAVPHATAPFIGTHENHAFCEYELRTHHRYDAV